MTLGNEAAAMARRFAALHIAHWRECKAKRLPRTAGEARRSALVWLAVAKGRS